jgi:Fe2+ transport system protein FeoA
MPIMCAPLNKELKITKIFLDEKLKKHFSDMGISINSSIQVLSSVNGNLICQVKEGRIAFDVDIAKRIFVE